MKQIAMTHPRVLAAVLCAAGAFLIPAGASAQQPAAVLPPIECAAEAILAKTTGETMNAGLALSLAHGFSDVWAVEVRGDQIASSLYSSSDRHSSLLAGLRVATSFYYGSNRDPVPGRFFAHVLAGPDRIGGRVGTDVLFGAGAEVLLSRSKPIGLHWEIDGRRELDAQRFATEFGVGVVIGPHFRAPR